MPTEWSNWSGSVRFRPGRVVNPKSEAELVKAIRQAASEGRSVRPVGALHSSSQIILADDCLVSLEGMQGLISADREAGEATLLPGTIIKDAGRALRAAGLAMHVVGDIDAQTVAGAIATGTHGSGRNLGNLATMLIGGRLVTASGDVLPFSIERDPELVRALRCSLGALGILSELRLRLLPAYRLHRREWCCQVDDCLAHLPELITGSRNFDFYWYPRRDEAKLRFHDPPGEGLHALPYAKLLSEQEGWADDIIAKERELKFDETEYALPAEAGPACFQELRHRIKERHRQRVGWRLLYRTVAADDACLSTAHARQTVTISVHHNAVLPHDEYFNDIQPIFQAHGGRPHWGKKHSLTAAQLRPLYPQWDEFQATRQRLDPTGLFLSGPLRKLLIESE
jgi:FAD/FMN-containing dehydrogenase